MGGESQNPQTEVGQAEIYHGGEIRLSLKPPGSNKVLGSIGRALDWEPRGQYSSLTLDRLFLSDISFLIYKIGVLKLPGSLRGTSIH